MTRRLTAALLALGLFAGIMALAEYDQKRRVDRLAAAEAKYDVTYLRAIRNGEGDALWRFADGSTQQCRISGDRTDPRLVCGADGVEPPVVR